MSGKRLRWQSSGDLSWAKVGPLEAQVGRVRYPDGDFEGEVSELGITSGTHPTPDGAQREVEQLILETLERMQASFAKGPK